MRYEVIVDGKSIGKHDFRNPPTAGDSVEKDGQVAVVKRLTHLLTQNKSVVVCETDKAVTPVPKKEKPATVEEPAAEPETEPKETSEAPAEEKTEEPTTPIRRGKRRS